MKYLTLTEAAKRLGADVSVVKSWVDQGLLNILPKPSTSTRSPELLYAIHNLGVPSISEPLVEEEALYELAEEEGWLQLVQEVIEKTEK